MIVRELFAKLGLDVDEKGFQEAAALIGGLKKGLIATVAGVAGVGLGLLEMARETANAGFEASKMATRLGTSTDAAQELAYAANAVGSSAETMQTSMFHMSRSIEAAREGSAEAQRALHGLGVPLHDLYKLKPDEQFTRLAGGLAKVKDQGQRAQKAQAIFGRGVVDLLPLINKGEEGIRAFREEAHEMGLVLSEETIADSKEWKRQMRLAGEQVDALKFKVGAFILKGLLAMSKAWQAFKKEHAEAILATVNGAIVALTAATIAYGLANAGALATAVSWYVALGIQALLTGGRVAAAWIASLGPIAAATVGVVFLGLAFEDIYHFFKGDKASLIGKVIDTWNANIHSFSDALKAVVGTFAEIVNVGDWEGAEERDVDQMRAHFIDEAVQRRLRERHGVAAAPSVSAPSIPAPMAGSAPSSFQAYFNIYTQPGMDEKALASHARNMLDQWHSDKVREAVEHTKR